MLDLDRQIRTNPHANSAAGTRSRPAPLFCYLFILNAHGIIDSLKASRGEARHFRPGSNPNQRYSPMAQADSHDTRSTPSFTIGRRALLGGAASLAAGAAVAAGASVAIAALAVDPIYAAIERHKQTAAVWDAAVDVRSNFNDLHMTAEQREQRDELDDAVEDAWAPCDQAGIDLVTAKPTTPAGIVAAIAYIRIQMRDDGTYMPHRMEFEYSPGSEGDSKQTMGWIDAFLETIASAAASLGKAVQS